MRKPALIVLALLTAGRVVAGPERTGLPEKLEAPVSRYTLSANGLADALARISKQFQVPTGIEWVRDKRALQSLSRTWEGDTVGGVLRSVVKEYPGYAWRLENGVVHVYRRDLVNDRRNFLNLKVPDFFEVRRETGGLTNQRLRAVAQNIVSPRNLPPGAGESYEYAGGVDEEPLPLGLSGGTFREALEKLADVTEHKIWVVTFSDSDVLPPTGFRRTETLWHLAPFPDTDQPMWDLLAWEEYLPASLPEQRPR